MNLYTCQIDLKHDAKALAFAKAIDDWMGFLKAKGVIGNWRLLRRKLNLKSLWSVLTETGHVTVSVSFLIICATIYTRMLAMSGMPQHLVELLTGLGLGPTGFLIIYVAIVLLLGTIIDSSSILLIVLPLMLPIAEQFGMNLIWFGVVTVVAVEIGLLTPPFGLSVYVIKSTLQDARITLGDIFRGTAPFTLMMLAVLLLLIFVPQLSLVLLKNPGG